MKSAWRTGDLLDARYRVGDVLARGGMGLVVSAIDLETDKPVAIKVLLPTLTADDRFVLRFLREAQLAMQLTSEHAVRVLHAGLLEDGAPFIVMEHLIGRDLATVLEASGPLAIPDALDYVLQAIDALADAHACGIVHRDIKPANLFLTQQRIKVLDFGIAKMRSDHELSLTRTSTIVGSPQYMSPEQLRDARDVDPRADIWALGATVYELIAGVPPFTGGTLAELCTMIMRDAPVPLYDRYRNVSLGLSNVIMRCLEKDPPRRHASVIDLGIALEPYRSSDTCNVEDASRPPEAPRHARRSRSDSLAEWLRVIDTPDSFEPP